MGASFSCQIAIDACLFAIRARRGALLVACAEWLSRRGALLPVGSGMSPRQRPPFCATRPGRPQ